MDQFLKKGVMLLNSLIYHYHGLDPDEEALLKETAQKYQAEAEMEWANEFIAEDYISAFERSRVFLKSIFGQMKKELAMKYLTEIWHGNFEKGYCTEMESAALRHLAKDWGIEEPFEALIESAG